MPLIEKIDVQGFDELVQKLRALGQAGAAAFGQVGASAETANAQLNEIGENIVKLQTAFAAMFGDGESVIDAKALASGLEPSAGSLPPPGLASDATSLASDGRPIPVTVVNWPIDASDAVAGAVEPAGAERGPSNAGTLEKTALGAVAAGIGAEAEALVEKKPPHTPEATEGVAPPPPAPAPALATATAQLARETSADVVAAIHADISHLVQSNAPIVSARAETLVEHGGTADVPRAREAGAEPVGVGSHASEEADKVTEKAAKAKERLAELGRTGKEAFLGSAEAAKGLTEALTSLSAGGALGALEALARSAASVAEGFGAAGAAAGGFITAATGVGVAVAGAALAGAEFAHVATENVLSMEDIAKTADISIEKLQGLKNAFVGVGADPGELAQTFKNLAIRAQEAWPAIATEVRDTADTVERGAEKIREAARGVEAAQDEEQAAFTKTAQAAQNAADAHDRTQTAQLDVADSYLNVLKARQRVNQVNRQSDRGLDETIRFQEAQKVGRDFQRAQLDYEEKVRAARNAPLQEQRAQLELRGARREEEGAGDKTVAAVLDLRSAIHGLTDALTANVVTVSEALKGNNPQNIDLNNVSPNTLFRTAIFNAGRGANGVDQLASIADIFQTLRGPQQTALGREAFNRSYNPATTGLLLAQGGDYIRRRANEPNEVGKEIQEAAELARQARIRETTLRSELETQRDRLGIQALPTYTSGLTTATEGIQAGGEALQHFGVHIGEFVDKLSTNAETAATALRRLADAADAAGKSAPSSPPEPKPESGHAVTLPSPLGTSEKAPAAPGGPAPTVADPNILVPGTKTEPPTAPKNAAPEPHAAISAPESSPLADVLGAIGGTVIGPAAAEELPRAGAAVAPATVQVSHERAAAHAPREPEREGSVAPTVQGGAAETLAGLVLNKETAVGGAAVALGLGARKYFDARTAAKVASGVGEAAGAETAAVETAAEIPRFLGAGAQAHAAGTAAVSEAIAPEAAAALAPEVAAGTGVAAEGGLLAGGVTAAGVDAALVAGQALALPLATYGDTSRPDPTRAERERAAKLYREHEFSAREPDTVREAHAGLARAQDTAEHDYAQRRRDVAEGSPEVRHAAALSPQAAIGHEGPHVPQADTVALPGIAIPAILAAIPAVLSARAHETHDKPNPEAKQIADQIRQLVEVERPKAEQRLSTASDLEAQTRPIPGNIDLAGRNEDARREVVSLTNELSRLNVKIEELNKKHEEAVRTTSATSISARAPAIVTEGGSVPAPSPASVDLGLAAAHRAAESPLAAPSPPAPAAATPSAGKEIYRSPGGHIAYAEGFQPAKSKTVEEAFAKQGYHFPPDTNFFDTGFGFHANSALGSFAMPRPADAPSASAGAAAPGATPSAPSVAAPPLANATTSHGVRPSEDSGALAPALKRDDSDPRLPLGSPYAPAAPAEDRFGKDLSTFEDDLKHFDDVLDKFEKLIDLGLVAKGAGAAAEAGASAARPPATTAASPSASPPPSAPIKADGEARSTAEPSAAAPISTPTAEPPSGPFGDLTKAKTEFAAAKAAGDVSDVHNQPIPRGGRLAPFDPVTYDKAGGGLLKAEADREFAAKYPEGIPEDAPADFVERTKVTIRDRFGPGVSYYYPAIGAKRQHAASESVAGPGLGGVGSSEGDVAGVGSGVGTGGLGGPGGAGAGFGDGSGLDISSIGGAPGAGAGRGIGASNAPFGGVPSTLASPGASSDAELGAALAAKPFGEPSFQAPDASQLATPFADAALAKFGPAPPAPAPAPDLEPLPAPPAPAAPPALIEPARAAPSTAAHGRPLISRADLRHVHRIEQLVRGMRAPAQPSHPRAHVQHVAPQPASAIAASAPRAAGVENEIVVQPTDEAGRPIGAPAAKPFGVPVPDAGAAASPSAPAPAGPPGGATLHPAIGVMNEDGTTTWSSSEGFAAGGLIGAPPAGATTDSSSLAAVAAPIAAAAPPSLADGGLIDDAATAPTKVASPFVDLPKDAGFYKLPPTVQSAIAGRPAREEWEAPGVAKLEDTGPAPRAHRLMPQSEYGTSPDGFADELANKRAGVWGQTGTANRLRTDINYDAPDAATFADGGEISQGIGAATPSAPIATGAPFPTDTASPVAEIPPDEASAPAPEPFATGGSIAGPGTATSDSIHMMLPEGGFVLKADTVRKIGVDRLDAFDAGTFKNGGHIHARVSDGEYFVRPDRVEEVGVPFMHALNEGRIEPADIGTKFAGGGLASLFGIFAPLRDAFRGHDADGVQGFSIGGLVSPHGDHDDGDTLSIANIFGGASHHFAEGGYTSIITPAQISAGLEVPSMAAFAEGGMVDEPDAKSNGAGLHPVPLYIGGEKVTDLMGSPDAVADLSRFALRSHITSIAPTPSWYR